MCKNLLDPYNYTVADNSPDMHTRQIIMQLCKDSGVGYIGLPRNFYNGRTPSHSHGLALNWVYKNYIKPRQAAYFGFIDHDIFPIRPTGIIESLEEYPCYGLIQERESLWYLWPGFSFFRCDYVNGKKVDFMPIKGGDTGAGNWVSLYTGLDKTSVPHLKHTYIQLKTGDKLAQLDKVEQIGDWIHTFNASSWLITQRPEEKESIVAELLLNY